MRTPFTTADLLDSAADMLEHRPLLQGVSKDQRGNRDTAGYVIAAWQAVLRDRPNVDPRVFPPALRALARQLGLDGTAPERVLVRWNDEHGTKAAALDAMRAAAKRLRDQAEAT